NVETHTVARPMEIALHAAVYQTGFKARLFEAAVHLGVDFLAIRTVSHRGYGFFLRGPDRLVERFHLRPRLPLENRAAHIRKVARSHMPRKHIHDDGLAGFERARPFIV